MPEPTTTPLSVQVYSRVSPSGSTDADPLSTMPAVVTVGVNRAVGGRFWLRRNTPEDKVVSRALERGSGSTKSSVWTAVEELVVAELYVNSGRLRPPIAFVMRSAMTSVRVQPPRAPQAPAAGGAGAAAVVQVCVCS